jgi:radical SAM superfamily enzyme YgiQ (UPF0313 family)
MKPHSKGTAAHVLLTSVFRPFAQDDEYGSRAINPMELYHNQVTREQGPFSLRMFHRSWGILFIQHNISAASTVLDFPTRERFVCELTSRQYDIVGISAIVVNVGKVREMCRLVRQHSPRSQIVIGGHVTAIPNIERMVDADFIVKGDGVSWFRAFLGEAVERPINHPAIRSSHGLRLMGIRMPAGGGAPAATIIPSVGCPMGCNFCTTSAFFGGKGRFLNFYERGADLFRVMCEVEARLGVSCFFMMDENFLLYKKRALELLECMKARGKAWSLYVFSSANALAKHDVRQLVELGVDWVWLALESPSSDFAKLHGVDTLALTKQLQQHGIRVHGSTIIGLDHHTPENISDEIEYAVAHDTDCHQFMLCTPMPGTPLYAYMAREGRLLSHVDLADIHGQYKFNFQHPAISREESKRLLDWAFRLDYERNGPSVFRLMRTTLQGWRRYREDDDPRVRARVAAEGRRLRWHTAALGAMERCLRSTNAQVSERIRYLYEEIERELGGLARWVRTLGAPPLAWSARREARRFPEGRRLEPPTFVDRQPAISRS